MPQSNRAAQPSAGPHSARNWQRARAIVMHYGANSMAYQILNPGMQWWFSTTTDAVVGYRMAAGYAVVAGEPVCHPLQQVHVAREFAVAMAPHPICYFGSEPAFAQHLQSALPCDVMWLGMQPWWQPAVWHRRVWAKQSLRALFSYARRRGVVVPSAGSSTRCCSSARWSCTGWRPISGRGPGLLAQPCWATRACASSSTPRRCARPTRRTARPARPQADGP